MDAADRGLLEKTVRDALATHVGTGNGSGIGSADGVLAQLGWLEMLEAEPRDAIDIVCTALGATNATATVLDDVLAAALGEQPRAELAVLLPPFASSLPPGRVDGNQVSATGLTSDRVHSATELLVVCDAGLEQRVVTVPMAAVDITPVRGIDPTAGLCAVRIDSGAVTASVLDPAAWDTGVAAGRRAVAHQITGSCRAMLELARTHALERVQFGRPVARFQAVRHRLAETLVAIEAIDAALGAAWDEPGPPTAALAKAIAGQSFRSVATHCQQVLAGIGFTTDHPFHRFLKRGMVLEGLFGSVDQITVELGTWLLDTGSVPTLIEL